MSEPSPAWPIASEAPAPPPAPVPHLVAVPPAQPSTPAPALLPPPSFAAVEFMPPATPAATLGVGVPLARPAPPSSPVVRDPIPAPTRAPSVATPQTDAQVVEAPDVAEPVRSATVAGGADPNGEWWSPANALVLGMLALMLQLVSFYAREQLPARSVSGVALDRFDTIVGSLPVVGSAGGGFVALLVAAGSLAVLLASVRRGVREPVLQAIAGTLAGVAVLCTALLGLLFGA